MYVLKLMPFSNLDHHYSPIFPWTNHGSEFSAGVSGRLTEEALEVLWTAVVGPVGVLQVPDGPLVAREQVFDLEAGGGVASRVCPEAGGDLEAAVRHRVVARAQPRPVAEALLPTALLQNRRERRSQH